MELAFLLFITKNHYMGRAKETVGKKEVRNKQIKKHKEKQKRKQERKEQKSRGFDDMIAYVGENGQILSEQPTANNSSKVKAENIEVSVPKGGIKIKDTVHRGKVHNYNESKGYGFIKSIQLPDSVFFHINDCTDDVKTGDKVEFETEKGAKGLKAMNVKVV